ncbi:MAG: 2,3-bisphosphoglycerate-independent phosphoglycerate mutase [Candidatus Cloacimonetes bacterium]|nr:2,3-bisphosphoglycerate-independent phosphoglycerate mutase [Candidatus Cloacimonadota bacterium]
MQKRVLLMILDGWGINPDKKGNAIAAASTPNMDQFFKDNPQSVLKTSGLDVGLPEGVMGNSEVGHMNIGAGRVVYQLNTLIDKLIEEGEFYKNKALNKGIDYAKENKSKLHLFILLSDGNVHSNLNHLKALLELCRRKEFSNVYLHAFMDGRDTLPNSGLGFMKDYLEQSKNLGFGKLASISGRYYAMDRDKRWERIQKAYDALVHGEGEKYEDPLVAIKESYENEITDEFIIPKVIIENDKPVARIEDGDSIIFLNFRADRTRQLTRAFIIPDFNDFPVEKFKNLHFVSMSEYDISFNPYLEVAFRNPELKNILGEVLANHDLKQLRLAETEKYAHVTFFFNCGREEPFKGEERILIPSPKVASYDLQPEMSALEVKDKLLQALQQEEYSLIVVNFANCDMVGHTGVFEAAVKAVETVDLCVGEIVPQAKRHGYDIIITADHGNAEKMLDENDNIFTAHTTNIVPIGIYRQEGNDFSIEENVLGALAPTILSMLDIPIPEEMDVKCLIKECQ